MYTSHSSRLGVLPFWFVERVSVGASPYLKRRAYGRNNSQHCWPENVGSCWIVQTNSTTPNNVGTSSALCHNIYKLKEFKRQYCDTREWSSRRPCVMRGRGIHTLLRYADWRSRIKEMVGVVGQTLPHNTQQHTTGCANGRQQTIANNVGSCWLSMFRPFALSVPLWMERFISTAIQSKLHGKWQSDRYIQGDRYIQVNFAENIRQLKILGSCPVTVIYRVQQQQQQLYS